MIVDMTGGFAAQIMALYYIGSDPAQYIFVYSSGPGPAPAAPTYDDFGGHFRDMFRVSSTKVGHW